MWKSWTSKMIHNWYATRMALIPLMGILPGCRESCSMRKWISKQNSKHETLIWLENPNSQEPLMQYQSTKHKWSQNTYLDRWNPIFSTRLTSASPPTVIHMRMVPRKNPYRGCLLQQDSFVSLLTFDHCRTPCPTVGLSGHSPKPLLVLGQPSSRTP